MTAAAWGNGAVKSQGVVAGQRRGDASCIDCLPRAGHLDDTLCGSSFFDPAESPLC